MPNSIYISAAHKSSGKTIVSIGLAAALKSRDLAVQTFKKGPDYIDPIWLSKASGRACYNLDFYNMTNTDIRQLFQQHSADSDAVIVEGNKGLFDGVTTIGGDANADLAKLLQLPVILVLDVVGITRGVAALIQGYQGFDAGVNIAGVILNKVAGARHESKLIQAIEHYTEVAVLGSISRTSSLIIDERHLGLVPANEADYASQTIAKISSIISEQVDIDSIISLGKFAAAEANNPNNTNPNNTNNTNTNNPTFTTKSTPQKLKVAVAKDRAFGFYYQDDLDEFTKLGVEIKYFDTLKDDKLPDVDGLFIGGGFPEMVLVELAANQALKKDLKAKIEAGLPTYAECGGLMYLSNKIKGYEMVGVIDAETIVNKKPIGRGYVELLPNKNHPWAGVADKIFAHEFHYSELINLSPDTNFAYEVRRGVDTQSKKDGIIIHNLLASYSHLRSVGNNSWVCQFVNFIEQKL